MNEVVNNSSIAPGGGAGAPTPPTPATPRVEVMPPIPPRPVPAAGGVSGGKKPGKPLSFWIALILFFGLGLSFLMNLVLLAFQGASSGLSDGTARKYHEERVDGSGRDKIAVIEVNGVIMDYGGGFMSPGNSVVRRTVELLRQASEDASVKAIVLSVDSPGGGVTASDLIYHEVLKAKQAGKKIVVHMGDLCASGGYYISAPADRIVASPTTITGSIGVIMSHLDYHELMEKTLLIKQEPIKSGPHKDILSPARAMTAEERQILQGLIDSMYKRFVDLVIDGRKGHANFPADRDAVVKIADGRVYTGEEAVKLGLADATGYLEDAYQEAVKAANLSDYRIIKYTRQPTLLDVLGGNVESKVNINAGVQIDAGRLLQDLTPRLEYRWSPGP